MQGWKSWCRLCAYNGINEIDIFFTDIENSCSIAEDLEKLCNLKLENTNDLPSKICKNCRSSIKNLKDFLTQSITTQEMFVEFQQQKNESDWNSLHIKYKLTNSTEIKEEQVDIFTTLESIYNCEPDLKDDNNIDEKDFLKDISDKDESSQRNSFKRSEDCLVGNNHEELDKTSILRGYEEETLTCIFLNGPERKITVEECETSEIIKSEENTSKDLINKISKSKNVQDEKKKSTKYPCKICEKSFSRQGGLTVHMKIRHSILKDPYKCKFCEKTFERRSRLEIHENGHLPSEERKQLSCPHCEKKFNSESGRWSHIHSVHDKNKAVICEECGKEFSTKHHLVKHKISHSQEKNLQCPHCPARFKAKVGLTAHIEIHGESFPCSICGVLLNTKQLLKKHMVVHSDVKDFKCNFCNKDFKRSKELNYHLITHIGIKPFECRICNQKFVHDMTYRRHLKATHPTQFAEMVAKGERISCRNFPPPEQLKAINEAAKNTQ